MWGMGWWWLLPVGAVVLVVLAWCYTNRYYRLLYGRPLRWPYFWAAHGALLWSQRFPKWEKR